MKAKIRQWGNSAALQIPTSIMKAAGLRIDQAVDLSEQGGWIVIEPIKGPVYNLEYLLSR